MACSWTLLYASGLQAKYWLSAMFHSVYLHNRLVHTTTKKTLFKAYFGIRPNLAQNKLFGSWVCVKEYGICHGKLGCHNFKGIFLGYTATDQNIVYLNLTTGVVKLSHHVQFDKAWYLQVSWPPTAQLLYDIGIKPNPTYYSEAGVVVPANLDVDSIIVPQPPWPLMLPQDKFLHKSVYALLEEYLL
jgi:hypothetical protein